LALNHLTVPYILPNLLLPFWITWSRLSALIKFSPAHRHFYGVYNSFYLF
jgi:hypothetical protein